MSVFENFDAFKEMVEKMAKEGKITGFIDELGQKRFCVPDGNIIFCPKCKYPMEISDQFKCKNCNKEFKLIK
jgi:hypothetical protein